MNAQTMIVPVIIAGGTGLRFWPTRRRSRPAPLLSVAGRDTLLQRTALEAVALGAPIICCPQADRAALARQMAEKSIKALAFLLEPEATSISASLAVACQYLEAFQRRHAPLMLVMPGDHAHRIGPLRDAVDRRLAQVRDGALLADPDRRIILARPEILLAALGRIDPAIADQSYRALAGASRYKNEISLQHQAFGAIPAVDLHRLDYGADLIVGTDAYRPVESWAGLLRRTVGRRAA